MKSELRRLFWEFSYSKSLLSRKPKTMTLFFPILPLGLEMAERKDGLWEGRVFASVVSFERMKNGFPEIRQEWFDCWQAVFMLPFHIEGSQLAGIVGFRIASALLQGWRYGMIVHHEMPAQGKTGRVLVAGEDLEIRQVNGKESEVRFLVVHPNLFLQDRCWSKLYYRARLPVWVPDPGQNFTPDSLGVALALENGRIPDEMPAMGNRGETDSWRKQEQEPDRSVVWSQAVDVVTGKTGWLCREQVFPVCTKPVFRTFEKLLESVQDFRKPAGREEM